MPTFRGKWDPDYVQYDLDDVVEYDDHRFQIIQPHRSQADWPPSQTPALWRDIGIVDAQPACPPPDVDSGYQPSYAPPQSSDQPPQAPVDAPHPTSNPGYQAENGVEVEQHETEKPWYDLNDGKKQALLAGGLALGLGALAGGAYYVHNKHKAEEGSQDEKAQAWAIQNWIVASQRRTEEFLARGPQAPLTWVFSDYFDKAPQLRNDLIPGGEEEGQPWFIARALHNGGLQVGKCRAGVGAIVGFGHEAIHVKKFEALLGDQRAVRWVPYSGRLNIRDLGGRPVEGGREDDGTVLVIARAHAQHSSGLFGLGGGGQSGTFPGKASEKLKGAYVTVGDKEVEVDDYEVLCFA